MDNTPELVDFAAADANVWKGIAIGRVQKFVRSWWLTFAPVFVSRIIGFPGL
jgi:hypothetical protein